MKKYKVTVPMEYIQGYLRYGHGEVIIEANTEEEAKEKVKELRDDIDIFVDDYEIDDYEYDYKYTEVEEIK